MNTSQAYLIQSLCRISLSTVGSQLAASYLLLRHSVISVMAGNGVAFAAFCFRIVGLYLELAVEFKTGKIKTHNQNNFNHFNQ